MAIAKVLKKASGPSEICGKMAVLSFLLSLCAQPPVSSHTKVHFVNLVHTMFLNGGLSVVRSLANDL